MAKYIMCTNELAKQPLLMKDLDIRVYSAEELCYYIYQNLYVISDAFMDDLLVNFLEQQCNLKDVAEKIKHLIDSRASLGLVMTTILKEINYYNEAEIENFEARLEQMKRQNPLEKLMLKANLFYKKGKYQSAIKVYKELLEQKRDQALGNEFYARVRQHMAVCFLKLYLYPEAMEQLVSAYKEASEELIWKQIYNLSNLSGLRFPDIPTPDDMRERAWQREFNSEYEKATSHVTKKVEFDEIPEILSELKKDYRKRAQYFGEA